MHCILTIFFNEKVKEITNATKIIWKAEIKFKTIGRKRETITENLHPAKRKIKSVGCCFSNYDPSFEENLLPYFLLFFLISEQVKESLIGRNTHQH